MNFIEQIGATVDFGFGNVRIGTDELYMMKEPQSVLTTKLMVKRATIIAARSEQLINGHLKTACAALITEYQDCFIGPQWRARPNQCDQSHH